MLLIVVIVRCSVIARDLMLMALVVAAGRGLGVKRSRVQIPAARPHWVFWGSKCALMVRLRNGSKFLVADLTLRDRSEDLPDIGKHGAA